MPEIELSAGTIEYEDTGGSGPIVVLLHGLASNCRIWDGVAHDWPAWQRMLRLYLGGHD